jgi:hypothetical protein
LVADVARRSADRKPTIQGRTAPHSDSRMARALGVLLTELVE